MASSKWKVHPGKAHCHKELYWNTAMSISLHAIYGLFGVVVATDGLQSEKQLQSGP